MKPVKKDAQEVSEKIKVLTLKNKKEQAEQIYSILVRGAMAQQEYLKELSNYIDIHTLEGERTFMDI